MYPEPNDVLAKKLTKISIVLSVAVLLLVGVMRQVKISLGIDFSFLPPVHAILNTLVTICLLTALYYIKKKDIDNNIFRIIFHFFFTFFHLIIITFLHNIKIKKKIIHIKKIVLHVSLKKTIISFAVVYHHHHFQIVWKLNFILLKKKTKHLCIFCHTIFVSFIMLIKKNKH